MFRRYHPAVKAIGAGDLEGLRKILEHEPDLVDKDKNKLLKSSGLKKTSILHIAARSNQPDIVRFLLTEKNMDVNKAYYSWSVLHYAATAKVSHEVVKTLLELGADPCQLTASGNLPYAICEDLASKKLLQDAYDVQYFKETLVKQEKSRLLLEGEKRLVEASVEKEQEDTADNVKGRWTKYEVTGEYIFEHDLPAQKLRFTEIFNLAAEEYTLVIRDIPTGHPAQPVIRSFAEMKDQTRIDEAKELDVTLARAEAVKKRTYEPVIKTILNK